MRPQPLQFIAILFVHNKYLSSLFLSSLRNDKGATIKFQFSMLRLYWIFRAVFFFSFACRLSILSHKHLVFMCFVHTHKQKHIHNRFRSKPSCSFHFFFHSFAFYPFRANKKCQLIFSYVKWNHQPIVVSLRGAIIAWIIQELCYCYCVQLNCDRYIPFFVPYHICSGFLVIVFISIGNDLHWFGTHANILQIATVIQLHSMLVDFSVNYMIFKISVCFVDFFNVYFTNKNCLFYAY